MEYKISKESVDKVFPKKDIDILGYESPIQAFIGQMRIERERTMESEVIKALQGIDVTVDKEELIKALQYDRNQYEKGYINGYNAKASDLAEEIFAEIEEKIDFNLSMISKIAAAKGGRANGKTILWAKHDVYTEMKEDIAELKKKYTEEGK